MADVVRKLFGQLRERVDGRALERNRLLFRTNLGRDAGEAIVRPSPGRSDVRIIRLLTNKLFVERSSSLQQVTSQRLQILCLEPVILADLSQIAIDGISRQLKVPLGVFLPLHGDRLGTAYPLIGLREHDRSDQPG